MRLAVIALLAFGCASAAEVPFDEPVTVQFGESIVVGTEGTTITFVDVADSRCPRNAICVWQGEVHVRVGVGGANFDVKVPGTIHAAGYAIEVREVTPYPDDPPPPKSSYRATMVVGRDG
jgi:hypothetical protein